MRNAAKITERFRIMSATAAALLFSLSVSVAHAELQYWVSVHSFSKESTAQSALASLDHQLTEQFKVLGASTGKGYFYRVASGPYMSRQMAEEQVRSARAAGYEGAWLWSDDSTAFAAAISTGSGGYSSSNYSGEYSSDAGLNTEFDTSYDLSELPDYDSSEGADYGEEDADLIQQRQPPPELVEEAPSGYKLNKLRRDA